MSPNGRSEAKPSPDSVRTLHFHLDALGIEVDRKEVQSARFGATTRKALERFQKENWLPPTGEVDEKTASALAEAAAAGVYAVRGAVRAEGRAGLDGLTVEIVDRHVGGETVLAEVATDATGRYEARFTAKPVREKGKDKPDLQVRVRQGDQVLGHSEVVYNAPHEVVVDAPVALADAPTLGSEHDALLGVLQPHVAGSLADVREDDELHDISYLANKTGWDARAVAMAALAERFAGTSRDGTVPSALFYALFRAGVPANEQALVRLRGSTLEGIWRTAIGDGVIPAELDGAIPEALAAFDLAAAALALGSPTAAGTSTLGALLDGVLVDEDARMKFAALWVRHRDDSEALWSNVATELGQETAASSSSKGSSATSPSTTPRSSAGCARRPTGTCRRPPTW